MFYKDQTIQDALQKWRRLQIEGIILDYGIQLNCVNVEQPFTTVTEG